MNSTGIWHDFIPSESAEADFSSHRKMHHFMDGDHLVLIFHSVGLTKQRTVRATSIQSFLL
jgi:hypothetical protein